jgi:8-oxo-dGTP pyrophosphatase MutT (NUDIX family)
MIFIYPLTKRVTTVTALLCISFQTSSLALTTRQQSPSSFLLKTIRHQQQPQRQQPQRCVSYCSSTVLMATADAETRTNEQIAKEGPLQHDERKLIQDMLYRIRDCNQMPGDLRSGIIDFKVDGSVLGKVDPKVVDILCSTSVVTALGGPSRSVFEMVTPPTPSSSSSPSPRTSNAYLTLSEGASGTTPESRTQAVATVMEELKEAGIVTGWRDELYPVSDSFYNPPFFLMERAATDLLGVLSYGVHINGILHPDVDVDVDENVEKNKNQQLPLMWMARRSKTKSKYPSMLDHIVAGGQPAGLSLMENVIKECEEEAGIPPEIAMPGINLRPAGVVSYEEATRCVFGDGDAASSENDDNSFHTISRVVLFNYDLYLPKEFVPKPVDGEVEDFFLWTVDQIKESMTPDFDDPIKPNCYLVIIDYLLRMGYVSPETQGYLDVLQELRSGDCR